MAIVFYYIKKEKLQNILSEGLEISKESNNQVKINGQLKHFITAYLSPKDELPKYNSTDYVCIELDAEVKDMYVLNGDLDAVDKSAYVKSLVPIEKYKFGTYRRPEVIVTSDILHDKIAPYSKVIGTPILFESSDKIYKNSVMDELRLKYEDFDETLLGIFFMMMVSKGRMKLIGQKKYETRTVYVYEDVASKKTYTLGIQEKN